MNISHYLSWSSFYRFKKKEDISRMTKSILKHKIQTLTGKSIKQLEEAMGYKVSSKQVLDFNNTFLVSLRIPMR